MVSANFPNRPFALREHVWLIRQEVSNNRSLMGWQLWVDKLSYSPTFSGGKAARWMKINGGFVHEFYGNGFDFRNGNNFLLASGEVWVGHNADGTKTFQIEASADFDVLGATSLSGPFGLPTIPRATQPSAAGSVDAGQNLTISLPRASAGFTHNIRVIFGSYDQWIANGAGTSHTWAVPMELLDRIPNAASGTGTIYVDTFNGGTYIGTKSIGITVRAGSAVVPSLTDVTISEAIAAVSSGVGAYVQGQSELNWTMVGAAGVYGSTITGYTLKVGGQTLSGASGRTGRLDVSGSAVEVVATVTDSRGRTKSVTKTINVLAWSPPQITNFLVRRALSNGTPDDNGSYLRVDVSASVSSLLVSSTQKNTLRYVALTKQRGATSWVSKRNTLHNTVTISTSFTIGANDFLESLAYDARIEIADRFATSAAQTLVAVAAVTMDWGDGTLGVGKFWEQGVLDVGGDAHIAGNVHVTGEVILANLARMALSGTTAQRDAYFGVPSTDAARVALANKVVAWFNTDLGWWETYYAPAGLSGLTARAIVAGYPAAWYPQAGSPIRAIRGRTAGFQGVAASAQAEPVLAAPMANIGGFVSVGSSGLQVPYPGNYNIRSNVYWSGGASSFVQALIFVAGTNRAAASVPKPDGNDQQVHAEVVFPCGPDAVVSQRGSTAASVSMWGTTGYNGTRLEVEYHSPPFA